MNNTKHNSVYTIQDVHEKANDLHEEATLRAKRLKTKVSDEVQHVLQDGTFDDTNRDFQAEYYGLLEELSEGKKKAIIRNRQILMSGVLLLGTSLDNEYIFRSYGDDDLHTVFYTLDSFVKVVESRFANFRGKKDIEENFESALTGLEEDYGKLDEGKIREIVERFSVNLT